MGDSKEKVSLPFLSALKSATHKYNFPASMTNMYGGADPSEGSVAKIRRAFYVCRRVPISEVFDVVSQDGLVISYH